MVKSDSKQRLLFVPFLTNLSSCFRFLLPVVFTSGCSHFRLFSLPVVLTIRAVSLQFLFDLMLLGKTTENRAIQEFVLVSPAPVDTAVKMSRSFRILAVKEKERERDILNASVFCEEMATELNAIAANLHGPALLLKAVDNRGMPFLDVLIECEQKEVVSHPSVQRYLSEVWTGHLSHWSGWMMLLLFCILLLVPPVWLAFSIPNKHIRFNKVPVIKFMSYLVSHIYLIVLITLTIVVPAYPIWESDNLIPHWYEWLLLAWLSGLLVSQLTNPEDRAGLGIIKVVVIAISTLAVLIHVIAIGYTDKLRLDCLYARNQFMGFALLLCFVQLLDFLSFHHLFGPWAIIIRDLMKDLMRFLVILMLFMMGFTLQLASIYRPVYAPIPENVNKGDGQGDGGQNEEDALSTFELLFFALFGLVDPENLPPINRNPMWSITLAKCVFGIYLIITIIVLINLLIAMMSDTYQRIQAQSDIEWKFGRAKLFRNMNKTSATPSPLNLFTKLYIYIRILVKHKSKSAHAQKTSDYARASWVLVGGARAAAWSVHGVCTQPERQSVVSLRLRFSQRMRLRTFYQIGNQLASPSMVFQLFYLCSIYSLKKFKSCSLNASAGKFQQEPAVMSARR